VPEQAEAYEGMLLGEEVVLQAATTRGRLSALTAKASRLFKLPWAAVTVVVTVVNTVCVPVVV